MQGLKYVSWGDNTGYAVTAIAYVRALIDAGVALTWTPMLPGENLYEPQTTTDWPCPKLASVCNKALAYDTVLIHTVPEYFRPWIAEARREGARVFGSTVWEVGKLPDHWPEILNQLDGVIVPCHWNRTVFRDSGVTVPIHVVPYLSQFSDQPVTSQADHQALQARLGKPSVWRDRFIFYTVGFWSNRKAPYLALEAYLQAFNADDPVVMIIKTNTKDITRWHRHWRSAFRLRHPSPAKTVAALRARYSQAAPVVVITDESLSDAEMLALHEMGDCFVSLTRTEGWGMGAFEAARLGKPVVMTGYGGQLDFLDPILARLVDYRMVPVHEPAWSSYCPSDEWADPSVAQAAQQLRQVFDDQQVARVQAGLLAEQIADRFSKASIIETLLKALA